MEVVIALTIAFLGGLWWGYEIGVRETEERWSDSVVKANFARDMEKIQ